MARDGSIRNAYQLRLRNKQGEQKSFFVGVSDSDGNPVPGLSVALEGGAEAVTVPQDATGEQRVYLIAPPGSPQAATGQTELTMWIEDTDTSRRASVATVFHGRGR